MTNEPPDEAWRDGLTLAEIVGWQERLLLAAGNGLQARPRDEEAFKGERLTKIRQSMSKFVFSFWTVLEDVVLSPNQCLSLPAICSHQIRSNGSALCGSGADNYLSKARMRKTITPNCT